MAASLPKDCNWIMGGDFNTTERVEDKSHDYGRGITEVERFSWNALLDALQLHDSFQHQGGIRFSWDNQQVGEERRLARLDRIYTPKNSGEAFSPCSYIISSNSLGLGHAPVKLELNIGSEDRRPTVFKWNASLLKESNIIGRIKERWLSLPQNMSSFQKLRHIARLYRWVSKEKAMAFKVLEEDTKRDLEEATVILHQDIYNKEQQGVVKQLRDSMRNIEKRNATGAVIRGRVKWKQMGDKCFKKKN